MHAEWGEIAAGHRQRAECSRATPAGASWPSARRRLRLAGGRGIDRTGDDAGRSPARRSSSLRPAIVSRPSTCLLTNFHLPRSTLFMLVAAFSGLDVMQRRLRPRHPAGYRFYSYGDACLLYPAAAGHDRSVLLRLLQKTSGARGSGEIATPRGMIRTPAFMPVGTAATVKAVYHRPTARPPAPMSCSATPIISCCGRGRAHRRLGGLHNFMRWDRPILTDCGGFQVMSLSKLRKITDEGVTFQSHIDGATHALTPGAGRSRSNACLAPTSRCSSTNAWRCRRPVATRRRRAVERSLAWGARCQRAFERQLESGRRASRARRCSASCRAAPMRSCRRGRPRRLVAMDFRRLCHRRAWPSARRRRRCWRRWS